MKQTCTHNTEDIHDTTEAVAVANPIDKTGIIPFADEPSAQAATPAPAPVPPRDSAAEAFGDVAPRESLADRELGINRLSQRREGKYACPCCGHGTSRVMRVRVAHRPGWSAVCAVCAATLLARVPGTIVGGRVRPTRRRQRPVPGQAAHGFRPVDQGGYRRAG